jgi:hypothetical protein
MDGKSIETYLAKAEEAERIAAQTKDEASRERWLDLAMGWRHLADQVERLLGRKP